MKKMAKYDLVKAINNYLKMIYAVESPKFTIQNC
jgi:hypothetical protein